MTLNQMVPLTLSYENAYVPVTNWTRISELILVNFKYYYFDYFAPQNMKQTGHYSLETQSGLAC